MKERWVELLSRLKLALPRMQEEFLERVADIEEYSVKAVEVIDLRETAASSIALIIEAMSAGNHYPRMRNLGSELGTRRARQGLSAEAVMSAVRWNFPVIWSTLLRESEPGDAPLLASKAEEVWRVVDNYAEAARTSYLETRSRMAQEESHVRQQFIAALFGPEGRLDETRKRFSKTFDVPPDVPYEIAAVKGRAATQLRTVARLPNRSTFVFVHESENYTYIFWPKNRPHSGRANPRNDVESIPCGLAVAEGGLATLPDAARIAGALAELQGTGRARPATVDSDWPRLARVRMDVLGVELGAVLESQLRDLSDDERDKMKETVTSFLSKGSVSAVADELYFHRNTILNRLRRFGELTGLDLTVPQHAARVVIAWA